MNFCKCGSIIDENGCSNKHCPESDKESTSWIINGELVRFKQLVTRIRAEEMKAKGSELILRQKPSKPWVDNTIW